MYLVTFSLATHLNAALADLPVEFGSEAIEGCRKALWDTTCGIEWEFDLYQFGITEVLRSPNDWLMAMKQARMERAWFTHGRDRKTVGDGILVERDGEQWFFRTRYEKRSVEAPNELKLSPIPLTELYPHPSTNISETAERLIEGIKPILDLALRNPETAFGYAKSLKEGLRYARMVGIGASTEDVSPLVSRLYPRGIYSVDHQLLMSAWTKSQILGGIGSWNDYPLSSDPVTYAEYKNVTGIFASSRKNVEDIASWLDFGAKNRS